MLTDKQLKKIQSFIEHYSNLPKAIDLKISKKEALKILKKYKNKV